jgi:hypothetical protein
MSIRKEQYFSYRSFWPEFEAMKEFHEANVNTVCIFAANTDNSLGKPYSKYPPVWRWFGKYDFASLDRQYDDVLAVNPDAEFISMVDLNTPIWLQRQLTLQGHSAECESFTMLSCACSNPAWYEAVKEYLEAFIKHMEERYGDRVKAYVLACGMTDEWTDYSQGAAGKSKTQAWKNWLKAKNKAQVPVPEFERIKKAGFENLIRDPETEQDIVDYAHFTGDIITDRALDFAAQTRKLIPEQRQIGMFFGYILELVEERLVWCGHLEYEKLYASRDIDFFISPGNYHDRQMGGGSGFLVPNGTRVRYGKGFLHEIDHRTPTYNCDLDEFVSIGWMIPWKNQAEATAGLKRELALPIVSRASLWCFDMWGGVFKTQENMEVVEQGKRLWDNYASLPGENRAEVALIVDPESTRYVNDKNPEVAKINMQTRNKLNRLGAPFEAFSFNDIAHVDLSSFKLFVFPGLFTVTPEKMNILEKYIFNSNRTVLFMYAPGICNGRNLDTARVKDLSGTAFNTPGVNIIEREDWKSVYIADYDELTPEVLKKLAADAGVHIYCREAVPVYANGNLLMIHTADGGSMEIALPQEYAKITELYSNKTAAEKTAKFNFEFKSPDTALFELAD